MVQANTSEILTQPNTAYEGHTGPHPGQTTLTRTASAPKSNTLNLGNNVTEEISPTKTHDSSDALIEKPTGLALYTLFAAVFSSGFLMALNGSMVATVSF
jgi:hypothetical protein